MPKPRETHYGIDDWAETVKDTLSQLGNKQSGSAPKPKPVKQTLRAGPSMTSYSRHKNRITSRKPRRR